MFLEVRKDSHTYMQHIDMDNEHIAPVTSNFRINLNHIAEISMYSIKEDKKKLNLENKQVLLPKGTQVIHLGMSYTHSTHKVHRGQETEHTVNERYFFKLLFLPGMNDEYMRLKYIIERNTVV